MPISLLMLAIKKGDISFSVGDQFRVVDEAADEGWLKVAIVYSALDFIAHEQASDILVG